MKLIQHIPPRLQEIKEIYDFEEAVQPEIDKLDQECNQILDNKNPLYADLNGVMKWEEWLRITPDPAKTLEQRQLDIVAKLNERLPFTLAQLYRILKGILGDTNFEIKDYPGEAKLDIQIDISKRDAAGSIKDLLKRIIPCHVLYTVIYTYKGTSVPVKVKSAYQHAVVIRTEPYKPKTNVFISTPSTFTEIIEVRNNA